MIGLAMNNLHIDINICNMIVDYCIDFLTVLSIDHKHGLEKIGRYFHFNLKDVLAFIQFNKDKENADEKTNDNDKKKEKSIILSYFCRKNKTFWSSSYMAKS